MWGRIESGNSGSVCGAPFREPVRRNERSGWRGPAKNHRSGIRFDASASLGGGSGEVAQLMQPYHPLGREGQSAGGTPTGKEPLAWGWAPSLACSMDWATGLLDYRAEGQVRLNPEIDCRLTCVWHLLELAIAWDNWGCWTTVLRAKLDSTPKGTTDLLVSGTSLNWRLSGTTGNAGLRR